MSISQNRDKQGMRGVLERRRPLLFILIVLCLLFIAGYTTRLGTLRRLEAEQTILMQQQEQAQIDTRVLTDELARVTSDAHVEQVAVESLGMAREGETVVTLVDAPDALEAPPVMAVDATSDEKQPLESGTPVWRQWLGLFAGAED